MTDCVARVKHLVPLQATKCILVLPAAVRSSSAASDPTTEKLECFLDHRSLLGMLQQRAPLQEDSTALRDPRHPLVRFSCAASCC